MPPPAYTFDVDAVVCIDADGTMTAYWKKESDGTYILIHTVAKWDGSATTSEIFKSSPDYVNGNDICYGDITVTITATGTDPDGSTLVDVDWDISCLNGPNAGGSGSFPLKVSIGASCPTGG